MKKKMLFSLMGVFLVTSFHLQASCDGIPGPCTEVITMSGAKQTCKGKYQVDGQPPTGVTPTSYHNGVDCADVYFTVNGTLVQVSCGYQATQPSE
jgi:hypothetical protein